MTAPPSSDPAAQASSDDAAKQSSADDGGRFRNLPDIARVAGIALISLVLVGAFIYAVWLTGSQVGAKPTYNKTGTLLFDPFARAKDLLTTVFPLVVTLVAFWLGQQGVAAAQKKVDSAHQSATAANAAAEKASGAAEKATGAAATASGRMEELYKLLQTRAADGGAERRTGTATGSAETAPTTPVTRKDSEATQ